ncbi:MAG: hypothetical protein NTV89_04695 [Proteobacteria bacterium]|nr:hypothetical protein [Pseudomonadota bacterium]
MLIIEIALGIVLAVFILRFLPAILAGAMLIGAIALLVVILLLVWFNLEKVAIYVAAIVAMALLYGVPFWLQSAITAKYPNFGALLRGEPPYDHLSKQPQRLLVMAIFALAIAGAGIAALLGAVYSVDVISRMLGK